MLDDAVEIIAPALLLGGLVERDLAVGRARLESHARYSRTDVLSRRGPSVATPDARRKRLRGSETLASTPHGA